jgi:hypothetical protein
MTDVGSWLLTRLGRGANAEVVAGDLMEAVAAGRSAGWYWRQVIYAIGVAWMSRTRTKVWPLAFSIVWSSLLWVLPVQIYWSGPMGSLREWLLNPSSGVLRASWSFPWPYSMIVDLGLSRIIDWIFVCIGMTIYLTLSRYGKTRMPSTKFLGAWVLSFAVYLAGRVALMAVEYSSAMGQGNFARTHTVAVSLWISLVLAFSVFCGIIAARSQHARRMEVAA